MALQKGVYGRLEGLLVEQPLQIERELDGVNVGRLNIIKRMEQKAFLQRRERQEGLQVRIFPRQPLNLALRKSNQRKIRRLAAADPRLDGSRYSGDACNGLMLEH